VKFSTYVHSWGGLGSQLFALAFILKGRIRHPWKKFVLVHHTSGVTRRPLEASLFTHFDIDYIEIDDFKHNSFAGKSELNLLLNFIGSVFKSALNFLGIVIFQSNEEELNVRPWTRTIRGHYFRNQIPDCILDILKNYFLELGNIRGNQNPDSFNSIFVHYRLGDLLTLKEKSPISKEQLEVVLSTVSDFGFSDFILDSDSPEIARHNFMEVLEARGKSQNSKINSFKGSLEEFISASISAPVFIGTNSKISIWIALFKSNESLGVSFLPKVTAVDFYKICSHPNAVFFY
jgi:hypothetical protein